MPSNFQNGRFIAAAVAFLALFMGLQYGYQLAKGSVIEHVVIDMITVKPCVLILSWLSSEPVWAEGHRILTATSRMSVLNGCEGVESIFLMIAAILAFPSTVRQKAWGLMSGVTVVYLTNQLRIASLFYAARYNRTAFDALHGYIAPTFIVLVGILFYLHWLKRITAL